MSVFGIPTASGTSTIPLTITDVYGNILIKTLVISVLEITTTALPDFTTGAAYSYQLAASGGSGSYVWSITSGSLPAGLTMNTAGLITGTPTGSTAETATFTVTDVACP